MMPPLRYMSISCGSMMAMPKTLPVVDMSAPVCCSPVAAGPVDDDGGVGDCAAAQGVSRPGAGQAGLAAVQQSGRARSAVATWPPRSDVSESTVSHHLSQLRRAGLVESERRGMNVFHRPRRDSLVALCSVLDPNCCR